MGSGLIRCGHYRKESIGDESTSVDGASVGKKLPLFEGS